ncbi:hypothetical protein JKF63_06513 [Porcisia hertigi]|uniref:Dephospho-CoA kinase n=1 Tax=Porcisia hertigi TaxID=2761500 RepID=A0A836IDS7_9TRYP|nr:hypothetical protein JKF63_06513 [Porcisia hertigi]
MKPIYTIGFTGTIASGKTARCKHLLKVAERWHQTRCTRERTAKNSSASTVVSSGDNLMVSPAIVSSPLAVHYINADLVGHCIYEPGKPCYYDLLGHFGKAILCAPSPAEAACQGVTSPGQEVEGTSQNGGTAPSGKAEPRIDRRTLGQIVFADERRLQELNSICWPYITAAIKDEHTKLCASLNAAKPLLEGWAGMSSSTVRPPDVFSPSFLSHPTPSGVGAPAVGLVIVEAALLCEMTEILALTTDVWMTHCTPEMAIARLMNRNHISREAAEQRVLSQRGVGQKLRSLSYKGDIEVFDTTQVTLAEGLKEVEETFGRYWEQKIARHL